MASKAQIAANRKNAKKSTGPKTVEGRETSSMNRLSHGFRSASFQIMECESAEEFEALCQALQDEHQPQTATERILVQKLAEHHWLAQRARDFQGHWLSYENASLSTMPLWLRYESQNDRAFHKCLAELRKVREERRKLEQEARERERQEAALAQRAEIGFERQKQAEAAMAMKKEANDAKVRLTNAKAERVELETAIKGMLEAPCPGNTVLNLNDLKAAIVTALFETLPQKQDLAQAA
jgi:hypothetical protein